MKTIFFITSNKGKFLEAKEKLSTIDIEVVNKNLGYPEIQADTLENVARFGGEHIQKTFNNHFILEDAGLFINVLHGFPGVYSSYVYQTIGCKGILKLLKDIEERRAVFRSVYAYVEPNKKPRLFVGECLGRISNEELGDYGFGYDPIFIPNNKNKTFAQMNINEKNCFSHRGKSLERLIDFFKKL
jgi:XTP/dITP diphosphohydrolase